MTEVSSREERNWGQGPDSSVKFSVQVSREGKSLGRKSCQLQEALSRALRSPPDPRALPCSLPGCAGFELKPLPDCHALFHLFLLHVSGEISWNTIPKAGWSTQPPQESYTTLQESSECNALKSVSDVLPFCGRQGQSKGARVRQAGTKLKLPRRWVKAHRWQLQGPVAASWHQPPATSRKGWPHLPPSATLSAPGQPCHSEAPRLGVRGVREVGTALGCGSLGIQP